MSLKNRAKRNSKNVICEQDAGLTEDNKEQNTRPKPGSVLFIGVIFVLAAGLFYSCTWFNHTYGFGFSQLLYTMTAPLEGTGTIVVGFILKSLLPAFSVIILAYSIAAYILCQRKVLVYINLRISGKCVKLDGLRFIRRAGAFLCVIGLFASLFYADRSLEISDYILSRMNETDLYENYYTDPQTVAISAEGETKNLIYIYLESMETAYMSVEDGGAQEINYIPNLTSMAVEYLSFSDNDGVGGFHSLEGTGYTMGRFWLHQQGFRMHFL